MAETMQALTYFGEGDVRADTRSKPIILEPADAIICIDTTTICEAMQNFKPGDKVLISCISRCGACENCQKQLYSHCENGGSWILGYMIDGTLAEYVRTPFADTLLYHLPDTLDKEVAVLLSDALPTGHEIGVQYGEVKPGSDIMIAGAGPVEMGATHTVNPANDDVKEGGNIAVVGVHGKPVEFQLQDMWTKNLTVTTGPFNANTTGMLMKAVQNSDLPITSLAPTTSRGTSSIRRGRRSPTPIHTRR